ncbi:cadmium-translocating P-type ATPase [Virgibacillus halodenitrificans]|uniref:heavy metal translocating P-type ATPase n=1 Tax=Virgibacillus halodenitrificans TaxID=1482 RepID=UPI001EEF430E|nr:heavy metal translocating P-type ATPase [Virgibacillus halodenitrificans]MCG1028055.1 cadmium-translocating P-type ATPase [Virgibacillus halodenitrificans]
MTTEVDSIYKLKRNQFKRNILNRKSLIKMKEHKELIAALISGITILFAWMFESHLTSTAFVFLHLLAFIIGGYAKAKEGITETITNKELNVEMLMIFAAIGSAIIGYWTEGAILIFIFALSGALETYTLNKSNKEISSLMNLQPEEAIIVKNGVEKKVPVDTLQVKDTVLIRAGERIPADGKISKGTTSVDESAITGESLPVEKTHSEEVYAGTVALNGTITIEITKPANETLFQKIIELVQQAKDEKSPSQLFIERFEGTYVKIVLAVVFLMMFLPYLLFNWTLSESIYRAMILLVVASPCALVASIMPATLSAISSSAKNGVLFKGGVHVENLSHIKAVAFDKTGTLTNGKPVVTEAFYKEKDNQNQTLKIVAAIEKYSTHPLAQSIVQFTKEKGLDELASEVLDMTTISGNGISAVVDGDHWKIGKADFVGKEDAMSFLHGVANNLANEGKTIVFAKKNNEITAVFALKDTIRKDAKNAIALLKKHGITTVMLTGDNELTAKIIAKEAGIDSYIANCLPEEKVTHVKQLREKYKNVSMVGDGINDAPALASANVGIAMGEGTDVAMETADVVLMKNDLTKITEAMAISTKMNKIIKQNVFFSLSIILILILSNFFQLLDLPLGVIGHEGSTILVILNGLRLLK